MLHASEITDGIARMTPLKDGIPVPAGQTVILERGGMHVMLMGLAAPLVDGGAVPLTLVFETAGEIPVTVPVGLDDARRRGRARSPCRCPPPSPEPSARPFAEMVNIARLWL